MNRDSTSIVRDAVRLALVAGATAASVAAPPAAAQDQDQNAADSTGDIDTVVVTGSRIRRVDAETASPVLTISADEIAKTGVTTMGDVLQRLPTVAGAATNPTVNNGGGTGESNVELRGLGAQRTLVLVDGRRVGVYGNTQTSAVDINMLPMNMIERVEVLKEGAGAIYGSDAIAGVVNFITRRNFDGAEIGVQYGQTGKSDGERQSASATLGSQSDRVGIVFGANYNKQQKVSAGDRAFAKDALYLYGGVVSAGGSSRTPNGRINLTPALAAQYGCGSVTRLPGAGGASQADYRCFTTADLYNYQPFNLLMTPQERGSLFTDVNYQLNDNVEMYGQVVYNQTRSGFALASLPFDAVSDDTIVSANSFYNPFGTDFGGIDGTNPNLRTRLESLGNRRSEVTTDQVFANAGFRGSFGNSWEWEANAGLGRMGQGTNIDGYLLKDKLAQALGPSFEDAGGVIRCGAPGAVIAGCTPIDIFNVQDPAQIAALRDISTNYRTDYTFRSSQFSAGLNGDLFDLPAGAVKAAFGAEYRSQQGVFETDSLTRGEAPLYLSCLLAQETCTGNSSAKYDVRELYGEFFLPLLAGKPGVQALNLTAGVRYSDYSLDTIGDDTTFEAKLEYRPMRDLMLRASYAEVFRAPTINDLSLAPTQTAATFNDPCANLTSAQLAANPNLALACVGVAPDSGFTQPNSQITGLLIGTPTLKPETGDVFTAGFVYDSSLVRGLSLNVDYWKYKIDDIITALDPNFAADQCVQTGNPDFCGLMYRYDSGPNAGEFLVFQLPNVNLGSLETDGIDIGVRYQLRDTKLGSWNFQLEATHINSFKSVAAPGAPAVEVAGTFDPQYGNYAKWRGVFGIGWSMAGFDGLLTTRYFDSLVIKDADGAIPDQRLDIPSVTYLDLTLGYSFPTNTRVQLGVQNLTDKQPPLFYQNNVTNANTDVSTYDLLGRQWYLSVTQKF
ncbi:MAG: Vitamin B12 transporter BtuB [Steroidobacteraceae bacterium]|nr:Vitamin B12 transporter BtuB [Steroidobacteraceae bacterium]